jgi:hypothetical protein
MGDNKGSTSAGNGKGLAGGAPQIKPMHILLPQDASTVSNKQAEPAL